MRKSALVLTALVSTSTFIATVPAMAETYEGLSSTIKSIDKAGRIQLSDNSIVTLDKSVKIEGAAAPGAAISLTYSADENGYVIETARIDGPKAAGNTN